MDFSWTQEQSALYDTTLHFAQTQLPRHEPSNTRYWTRSEWELCGQAGLPGLCTPAHYGGKGFDALTTAHALEAFGRGCEDTGLVFSLAAHLFACVRPIVEAGDANLKAAWLPELSSGRAIAANAITEHEAGSDIFALKTRAIRDGDSYIISGTKSYVSNGPVADLFLLYASTNPAHGYLGITAFLVPRETTGLLIGEPFAKASLTTTPACQVTLKECRIPTSLRLGAEGQGARIFSHSMHWERACLFAGYLGMMDRQLERTINHVRERRQFGKALGKHQAVAHRVAEMQLRLAAARLLLYHACWQLDQGQEAALASSLAKLAVSEAAIQSGLDALHLHGSSGIASDQGIEQMLRDALPGTIFSGTSEMQRTIIANELGL